MATETQENPFSFALENEITPEAVESVDPGLIDEIIRKFKESSDFTVQEYGYSLDAIKNSLNDENRGLINSILLQLEGEEDQSKIQDFIVEMQDIVQGRISESSGIIQDTRNQERAEIENRFISIFGSERWEEFRKVWNMEKEDYTALDRILDLFGAGALVFLDTAVDILQAGIVEGGGIALSEIWNGLSTIIENDYHFFVYLSEKENNTLLYLWAYIHVNGGLIAYRYMKDYLTTHFGEAINKRFPATTTSRTVKAEDGSTTTENVEKRHFVQRILGQGYLDAASPATNIFNLTDGASENLSAEQNEYLKRRHTMDILKSSYFDNPRMYRRLTRIENNYMQSNTKTFWRSTYRLMQEQNLVRRISGGILTPDLLKREMEGLVISKQQELQRNHYKAIGILYDTTESANGIDIDKNNETDFLKGLRFDIESDPSLTPGEKSARITALNTYLNRITGDTIISEEKLYGELFRIRDGQATKIRMLEKIQAELDEVRKGNLFQRAGGAVSDFLLQRRSNLRRFQQQISDGNWNGSFAGFEQHIKDIKSSSVLHRIPNASSPERNNDRFKTEMEARMGDVEANERLYNNSATDNLRNGIHYIVADNELEKSMDKVFKDFMEAKTPYTEIEFFRELERIGNGYLPSNLLLRRLEKEKAELERQRSSAENSNRGILDNLRRLRIVTIHTPEIPPTQREGTRNLLSQATVEAIGGNYRNAINSLTKIPNDVAILLGDSYKDTLRLINQAITARPTIQGRTPNNVGNTELDRQIANVEAFMEQARNGNADIKPSDIAGIKDGNNIFDANADYISDDFTEADRDRYKNELKAYEGIDQFDYKAGLFGDTSGIQAIETALKDRYKNELNNLLILSRINGTANTFGSELTNLAKSLHVNNYTRGQVAPIIERLIAGERFIDIDINNVVEATTDHSKGFSGGQAIKDSLQLAFEGQSIDERKATIDFIRNNSIPEEELPENIKRGIERFTNATEIDGHVSRLNGALADLETAQNIDDLRDIKTRFDRIIDTNTVIDPEDEEFKGIIEGFNSRFEELKTQFQSNIDAETRTRAEAEVTRNTQELNNILDELKRTDPTNTNRIDRLESRFDTYLSNNGITRTDSRYKELVEDFDDILDDKRETVRSAERLEHDQRFRQNHLDGIRGIIGGLETARTPGAIELRRDQINTIINNPNNHLDISDNDVRDLVDMFERNAETRLTEIQGGGQADNGNIARVHPQEGEETPNRVVPSTEIVNEDLEAAHKRAIDALKAAEIEVILHFDDPDIIQEKLNLIRTTLRIEANDTPFLARTMDFRASFAGSLGIPQIRSMRAIGGELWRLRTANPSTDLYRSAPALLDEIRNTTDPSVLHAIGENIRNLRVAR